MSRTVAKTLPIGPIQAYWNDVRLGSMRSQMVVRYNKETVNGRLEDNGSDIISKKIGETCEVDLFVADLKLEQMKYIFDQADSYTNTTISSENYTATTTSTMRSKENITFTGTAWSTLSEAVFLTTTIKVFNSEYSNTPDGYTDETDFTACCVTGNIARIEGGDIATGATVVVEYNANVTVSKISVGGTLFDFEGALRCIHYLADGKKFQFYAPRAKHIGASDTAIQIAAPYEGQAMTFKILADMSLPPKEQLFVWSEQV